MKARLFVLSSTVAAVCLSWPAFGDDANRTDDTSVKRDTDAQVRETPPPSSQPLPNTATKTGRISSPWFEPDKDNPAARTVTTDQSRTVRGTTSMMDHLGSGEKSSEVIGWEVRNARNEKLGKIEDLAIDMESGRIVQVIVGSGGFLGIGEKHHAVPPKALSFDPSQKVVMLNMDKERFKAAPTFEMSRWDEYTTAPKFAEVYRYYGQPAYWESGTVISSRSVTPSQPSGVGSALGTTTTGGISDTVPPKQRERDLSGQGGTSSSTTTESTTGSSTEDRSTTTPAPDLDDDDADDDADVDEKSASEQTTAPDRSSTATGSADQSGSTGTTTGTSRSTTPDDTTAGTDSTPSSTTASSSVTTSDTTRSSNVGTSADADQLRRSSTDTTTSQGSTATTTTVGNIQDTTVRSTTITPGDQGAFDRLGRIERAKKIVGMPVRNMQDERVGKVDNLIVDLAAGRVISVIVSTGGFLGMGDTLSAVPPQAFRGSPERDALLLDVTKERLASYPHFTSTQWPQFNDPNYVSGVYRSYNVDPYFHTGQTDVDNTRRNIIDRHDQTVTPLDQGNNASDIQITSNIRRAITRESDFSTNARNIKIITANGQTTLRGVVESEAERDRILALARQAVPNAKIDNQLQVNQDTVRER